MNPSAIRLLILGNPEPFHVGGHFRGAAESLGIVTELCDTREAYAGSALARKIAWRLRRHRPPQLESFSSSVVRAARAFRATHLLATGSAPLTLETMRELSAEKIALYNFCTDDPWNPTQRAEWFLRALPGYEVIFTPRHTNMDDLRALGCARVEYLPFAYNPQVHYPDRSAGEIPPSDVMFAGGADADRVPYLAALMNAGFNVRLYGGYWERYTETARAAGGHADLDTLRRAVRGARVGLNLVRRSNRDGHVMRSYEVPAMGGCLLTEDTPDHRALYGAEGESVIYFDSPAAAVEKTRMLLQAANERARLSATAHARITRGSHTYADRLRAIMELGEGRA